MHSNLKKYIDTKVKKVYPLYVIDKGFIYLLTFYSFPTTNLVQRATAHWVGTTHGGDARVPKWQQLVLLRTGTDTNRRIQTRKNFNPVFRGPSEQPWGRSIEKVVTSFASSVAVASSRAVQASLAGAPSRTFCGRRCLGCLWNCGCNGTPISGGLTFTRPWSATPPWLQVCPSPPYYKRIICVSCDCVRVPCRCRGDDPREAKSGVVFSVVRRAQWPRIFIYWVFLNFGVALILCT